MSMSKRWQGKLEVNQQQQSRNRCTHQNVLTSRLYVFTYIQHLSWRLWKKKAVSRHFLKGVSPFLQAQCGRCQQSRCPYRRCACPGGCRSSTTRRSTWTSRPRSRHPAGARPLTSPRGRSSTTAWRQVSARAVCLSDGCRGREFHLLYTSVEVVMIIESTVAMVDWVLLGSGESNKG